MTNTIISYDQADARLKAKMDRIIDAMTDSFDAVMNYGSSAVKKRQELDAEIRKAPIRLNSCLKSLGNHIGNAQKFNKTARLEKRSSVKDALRLSTARAECTREFSLYIGAAREILKRKILVNQEKNFIDAVYVLDGMHKDSIALKRLLKLTDETRKNQIKLYKTLFGNSKP